MYKITQQTVNGIRTNRYTISCYVFNPDTKQNAEVWVWKNMTAEDLQEFLKKNGTEEFDIDFNFVVLKSGNGPVILTDTFEQLAVSVKQQPIDRLQGKTRNKLPC